MAPVEFYINSAIVEESSGMADIRSWSDYYSFGAPMPGRTDGSDGYRYGFNGMEKDDEVKGSGNSYDYGFRIYNPRIGKFLSVDPFFKGYPWNCTYAYAENDVIRSIDIEGAEKFFANDARIFYV